MPMRNATRNATRVAWNRVGLLAGMLLVAALTSPSGLAGQEEKPGAMPTHTGKGKVTQAVDTDKGAVFDIGGGITLLLPKGLPVGHSRVLTLEKARRAPAPSQIHRRFKKQGRAVRFSGALSAGKSPMVLAMSMKREPKKRGFKLVLAVEEAGLCDKSNKRFKLGQGLCSVWRTVDAEYDHAGERIIAKLSSTGGLRLQFGWIPEEGE